MLDPVAVDCSESIRDLLGDEDFGYIVPQHDHRLIAEKIIYAISFPKDAKKMSSRVSSFMPEQFCRDFIRMLSTKADANIKDNYYS